MFRKQNKETSKYTVMALPEDAGLRLDQFLAAELEDFSRTRLKALIQSGQVRCGDSVLTKPDYRVKEEDVFHIAVPAPVDARPVPQKIPLDIIFEDEHLIVLNKPAGMVVHPAPGNPDGTLVNALLAHCGAHLSGIGGVKRPGIVHRLDKDTSGIMVVAKSDKAHLGLAKQLAARTMSRRYQAVVWGVPALARGTVNAPIGRHPKDRKKMAVVEKDGKEAITEYTVEERYGRYACLMLCRLLTGRTHQIRVHMAYLDHWLIGDQTYGRPGKSGLGKEVSEYIQEALVSFHRQALHAAQLSFVHPVTEESKWFSVPLPEDIAELLNILERLR